ncbi:hypothetical protein PVK06_043305 [Gossypium arboreum]|uniref:Reverse transcriptase zinc-binding domain-containing protein n=1 Tax=Gossypium arboreum TaxID=29729 RepID=A0ABR0MPV1_GOSAR|nr:hypothetical protein PVK06_043305 [Gossypium arboreum]
MGQLLRNKYRVQGVLPMSVVRSNCSYIWRSLMKVWPDVVSNVFWAIDDGRLTNFWNDMWVKQVDQLRDLYVGTGHPDDTLCVYDLVANSGARDWPRLSSLLPENIVRVIFSMIPPASVTGTDRLAWKWMSKDKFSSAETYRCLYHLVRGVDSSCWKLIWKAKVPQRVRVFLWNFWQDKLLTNGERARRHMTNERHCPRCGEVLESGLHVIRDCSFSRIV